MPAPRYTLTSKANPGRKITGNARDVAERARAWIGAGASQDRQIMATGLANALADGDMRSARECARYLDLEVTPA